MAKPNQKIDCFFQEAIETFVHASIGSFELSLEELEEEFANTLSQEDLSILELPPYLIPRLPRGLPSQYSIYNPTRYRAKQRFSDPIVLKKRALEKSLFALYRHQAPLIPGSIILFTWVVADGWGDYFAQLQTAEHLRKTFPTCLLNLITLIHKDKSLPYPQKTDHLLRYTGQLNQSIIYEAFSSELHTLVHTADLLIEIPTACDSHEIFHSPSSFFHLRIGEHSLMESLPFNPTTKAYCMGLHGLEMGIFTPAVPVDLIQKIRQFQYLPLLYLLFQTDTPQEKEILDYLKVHTFNAAYTKTFRGTYLYLHTLLLSQKEHSKRIDICFFHLELFLNVIKNRFETQEGLALLREWGIEKIEIYIGKEMTSIVTEGGSKVVRLIHCPSLIHEDFLTLLCFTQHLIGCTGDQSLCEAIGTKTPFFYDPPLFKRAMLKDLFAISATRLFSYPSLSRFFQLLLKSPFVSLEEPEGEWVSEDYLAAERDLLSLEEDTDLAIGNALAQTMNDPLFTKGFKALAELIQHEYAFSPLLEGMVKRALLHSRYPTFAQWEQEQIEKVGRKQLSAVTFLKELQKRLETIHK